PPLVHVPDLPVLAGGRNPDAAPRVPEVHDGDCLSRASPARIARRARGIGPTDVRDRLEHAGIRLVPGLPIGRRRERVDHRVRYAGAPRGVAPSPRAREGADAGTRGPAPRVPGPGLPAGARVAFSLQLLTGAYLDRRFADHGAAAL